MPCFQATAWCYSLPVFHTCFSAYHLCFVAVIAPPALCRFSCCSGHWVFSIWEVTRSLWKQQPFVLLDLSQKGLTFIPQCMAGRQITITIIMSPLWTEIIIINIFPEKKKKSIKQKFPFMSDKKVVSFCFVLFLSLSLSHRHKQTNKQKLLQNLSEYKQYKNRIGKKQWLFCGGNNYSGSRDGKVVYLAGKLTVSMCSWNHRGLWVHFF